MVKLVALRVEWVYVSVCFIHLVGTQCSQCLYGQLFPNLFVCLGSSSISLLLVRFSREGRKIGFM